METISQQYDAAQLDRILRDLERRTFDSRPGRLSAPEITASALMPERPFDGNMILVDGATSGDGLYVYYAAAWNKMDSATTLTW